MGAAEAAISESGTRSCFRTRTKGLERDRLRINELNSASDYALIKKLLTNRIDAIRRDLKMYKYKGGHLPSATFYRRTVYLFTHSRVTRIVSELAKLSASPRKTASHATLHFAVESGLANVTHPSEFECVLACLSNSREI